jgi:hypothetical protein
MKTGSIIHKLLQFGQTDLAKPIGLRFQFKNEALEPINLLWKQYQFI